VGVALARLARLALGGSRHQAGDGDRVASPRVSPLLDLAGKADTAPAAQALPPDVRALIRDMSTANPLWGAPRMHGELLKLGIAVSQSTVAKYMRRHLRPPSQTWRTFLTNHASQIMAADLFVVPTVTFRLLFVLIVLAHDRRRLVHVAVTAHPTAAWTAQQLRNAFSENDAPRYLLHDRDSVFAVVVATSRTHRLPAQSHRHRADPLSLSQKSADCTTATTALPRSRRLGRPGHTTRPIRPFNASLLR